MKRYLIVRYELKPESDCEGFSHTLYPYDATDEITTASHSILKADSDLNPGDVVEVVNGRAVKVLGA